MAGEEAAGIVLIVGSTAGLWWTFHPQVAEYTEVGKKRLLWGGWVVILILASTYGFLRYRSSAAPQVVVKSERIVEPRRLRPEQRAFLIGQLRKRVTDRLITITTLRDTKKEAGRYGEDFVEVFKAAGWIVRKQAMEGLVAMPVLMYFQFDDPVAAFLLMQLQGAGVEVEPRSVQYGDEIKFIVGPQQ